MKFFETASFHIVKPCNMKCKFCYATFDDMHVINQLPKKDAFDILDKLKDAGLQKITFAGGEPMLYKWIKEVVRYSKSIGLTTSIITNGSFFTNENIVEWVGNLDWIGVSIDSLDKDVCSRIGRTNGKEIDYLWLCMRIKQLGFKLKINTVVNGYNVHEDMNKFISEVSPERWKVFQALRVEGQNDAQFDSIKVSHREYLNYISRHSRQSSLVAEDNEAMTGSYLLVDPQGRLFENSAGKHTYSQPLQNSDIETCLSEINLNREMFVKRGGIYDW